MNKINSLLILIVFIQLFIITLLCCYAWQRDQNEKRLFAQLEQEIILLQDKDKQHEDLIGAIIRTEAMKGTFDKK